MKTTFSDYLFIIFEKSETTDAYRSHDEPEIFQDWVSELGIGYLDEFAEKWAKGEVK